MKCTEQPPKPVIVASLRDVHTTAAQKQILRGVTFDIPEGSITLISGPNGSGKSTALRTLAGLSKPDSGHAYLFGDSVYDQPPKKIQKTLRNRVGLGFQAPNLDGGMTVFDNLIGNAEAFNNLDIRRAGAFAVLLGLHDKMYQKTSQLSGGEMLRVSLGRLLIPGPELILLDEPTSMVDPSGKEAIYTHLRNIRDKEGTTVVMISHDEEAREIADQEIVIVSGQVAATRSFKAPSLPGQNPDSLASANFQPELN